MNGIPDHQPIYFIQEHLQEKTLDGSVGYRDAEQVLVRYGAIPIFFPHHYDRSRKAKWLRFCHLVKLFRTIPPGSIIIFLYPLYARMNRLLLRLLKYRKSIRIVCFLADINGLKQGNQTLLKKEIQLFRQYRYFIVHNPAMRHWLNQAIPDGKASMINFFDFLATPFAGQRTKSMQVVFAGNLSKSVFLETLHQTIPTGSDLVFHLYGPHVTDKMQTHERIRYKGVFEPYALPAATEGSFGLVWDGEGPDGIAGSLGSYMQYITHHKVSLYILCGLPLIVYEKAGSAELVKQYKIGVTISNLYEIENKLQSIPGNEYQQMCENTRALAQRISGGMCLTTAVQEIVQIIQQEQNSR